jgi:hypothetical protein
VTALLFFTGSAVGGLLSMAAREMYVRHPDEHVFRISQEGIEDAE